VNPCSISRERFFVFHAKKIEGQSGKKCGRASRKVFSLYGKSFSSDNLGGFPVLLFFFLSNNSKKQILL